MQVGKITEKGECVGLLIQDYDKKVIFLDKDCITELKEILRKI